MRSVRTTTITVILAGALALSACGGSTATDSKLELTSASGIEEIVNTPAGRSCGS